METADDRRVRRTKNLLIRSLATLMAKKNITDITVKELCELADINRGTFYLHYKDIYHMLESIEQDLIDEFQQIFQKYTEDIPNDFPYPLFLELFRLIDKNSELCRSLLGPNGDISFIMKVREVFRHQCMQSWIKKNASSTLALKYEYFSNFIIYGCVGLIEDWLVMNRPESPEEMATLVTKLVSTGAKSLL